MTEINMTDQLSDKIGPLAKRISESLDQVIGIRPSSDLIVDLIGIVIAHGGRMEGDVLDHEMEAFAPRVARDLGLDEGDRSLAFWIGHTCMGAVALGLVIYLQ